MSDVSWQQDTVIQAAGPAAPVASSEYLTSMQPGDIVRNINTAQERVVVSIMPNRGLIEFEDSHLVGWADAQGWIPTGRRAET